MKRISEVSTLLYCTENMFQLNFSIILYAIQKLNAMPASTEALWDKDDWMDPEYGLPVVSVWLFTSWNYWLHEGVYLKVNIKFWSMKWMYKYLELLFYLFLKKSLLVKPLKVLIVFMIYETKIRVIETLSLKRMGWGSNTRTWRGAGGLQNFKMKALMSYESCLMR